ncbi:MAG: hypothetical protein KKA73_04495, partial [Chloroflexi bacterium]|nr:hypothetical protein [Chloroflexota bacterium]
GRAAQPVSQPGGDRAWQQARPGLRRVYDQFYVWQQDPPAYAAARAQWYRAFSVETGMRAAPAANYPDRSW